MDAYDDDAGWVYARADFVGGPWDGATMNVAIEGEVYLTTCPDMARGPFENETEWWAVYANIANTFSFRFVHFGFSPSM